MKERDLHIYNAVIIHYMACMRTLENEEDETAINSMWAKRLFLLVYPLVYTMGTAQRLQVDTAYLAASTITFTTDQSITDGYLHVKYSYGSTILDGHTSDETTTFELPPQIALRTGLLSLSLYEAGVQIDRATTHIVADTTSKVSMEAYCGPKHLIVGNEDFTMLTHTILDEHDNPYPAGTKSAIKSFVEEELSLLDTISLHLLGYRKVYSTNRSGNGALSATFNELHTKEFRLDFYPSDPSNYQIFSDRQHEYGDGNQLVIVKTNTIHDHKFNKMKNGTLVYFHVTDDDGRVSLGTAETIDGVAQIELMSPNYPTGWTIHSYIPHFAHSDTLRMSFQKAIEELPVSLTDSSLQIGPVTSFIGQRVKEGMLVSTKFVSETSSKIIFLPLLEGKTEIGFESNLIQPGTYDVSVQLGTMTTEMTIEIYYE